MARYLFRQGRSHLASSVSGQGCGKRFLLPRILLFSLFHLYFLSGCPTYTSCLATGQSAFIWNTIDRLQNCPPSYTCIGPKLWQGISLHCSPPCILWQGISYLNLELTGLPSFAIQLTVRIPLKLQDSRKSTMSDWHLHECWQSELWSSCLHS